MANEFTRAFQQLLAAQTHNKEAIIATVGAFAVNKPAFLGSVPTDPAFADGTTAEAGTYELQMLASDFSALPTENTAVTCNGEAAGKVLRVLGPVVNANGIYTLTVGDPHAP